ncbi:MAG: transposase, partial [Methylobacter sp.]|nr:transposase [Methylobacter sp.]
MKTQTKTLKVRIKDKHTDVLNRMAFECNQVWNAANEESAEFSWVPIPEVGYINCGTSAFDLMKELKGIRKDRDMIIGAGTVQEVIAVHAKARKQFKKNKLRWRSSGGARRALGWVPFKSGAAVWVNGQIRFCGFYFNCW